MSILLVVLNSLNAILTSNLARLVDVVSNAIGHSERPWEQPPRVTLKWFDPTGL